MMTEHLACGPQRDSQLCPERRPVFCGLFGRSFGNSRHIIVRQFEGLFKADWSLAMQSVQCKKNIQAVLSVLKLVFVHVHI